MPARQVLLYWSQVVHSKWKSRTNSEKRVFQAEKSQATGGTLEMVTGGTLVEFSKFSKEYQQSKTMTGTGTWIGAACAETSRRLGYDSHGLW